MTEKRFTLAYETNDQNCIWWAVRNGDITLWKEEVVDLLNKQHETIQSLISDSEKYRKLSIQFDNRNKELVSENALLEKENEQLKSSDNLADCECEIAKLRKENEQLKNENAKMKKELSSLAEFNQKAIL